ncbi:MULTISPECIES: SDR family oxidoreductase [unclassified Mycobacterium]|uniref:SDR family NAD(P)-dependent oxidoreductase n=1 Tax=unclassified Mycobacterium TaxID=2642494 RepID=UPI00048F27F3|nr:MULTISPECIES: SDR family oxidoreductase [unclassified Mycobacterium]SEA62409.1 Short-chain dehydrogenase [Mycobacterium sp. 283mftsu]
MDTVSSVSTARAAIVTGASRGIGRLIARRLAATGWDLTICARSIDPLELLAKDLTSRFPIKVMIAAADMGEEADLIRIAETHRATYGRLDALVLNAGMGSIGPFHEFPVRRFDKLFAINVRSAYVLVQQCLPLLRLTAASQRGGAKVIAVSSMTGLAGEPLNSAYGATKAALTSLCETLNTEESQHGVAATAVCPGYVATDMTAPLADTVGHAEMIDPEDVAELVVSLTRLSSSVVVPVVAMTRPGSHLWRA